MTKRYRRKSQEVEAVNNGAWYEVLRDGTWQIMSAFEFERDYEPVVEPSDTTKEER